MNQSIYNITTEYRQLAERIIDNGGEIDEQDEQALQINKEQLQFKAVQFALIVKDNENGIESIEKEIKRLQALKSAKENANTRLKDIVKSAMQLYEITEIKGENFKIGFRKSKSVEIINADEIPAKYKELPTEPKILKKEIGDDLKAGLVVHGAKLNENQNLQIK